MFPLISNVTHAKGVKFGKGTGSMDLRKNAPIRTDLYELTMMQGYWATGMAYLPASFELFFRNVPENGGYCIAAGIDEAIETVVQAAFTNEHLDFLRSLERFDPDFLDYLETVRFTGDIRAVPEGTLIFPNEPILEVTGSILEAQWIESLILNCVNFQTLIATKASRMVTVAYPANVIEIGLRRAQGPNGGLWAARAAYLGGSQGTSNVEAAYHYGIPVFGTHAHSWVMSFEDEARAFKAYAETFPTDSVFLLDTYDTLESGLPHAIEVAKKMEEEGSKLLGVRLDSGDLAYLSKACRKALDSAGLPYVKIVASSDIDEYLIQDLNIQDAPIDIFGVGTRLATAMPEPALTGVYKLVAVRDGDAWKPKIKISSNPAKTTIPGRKQVWRWDSPDDGYAGDVISLFDESSPNHMRHPDLAYKHTRLPARQLTPLLVDRVRTGEIVKSGSSLEDARTYVQRQLQHLPSEHRRLTNPHTYRVGLSDKLWRQRHDMIEKSR